MTSTKLHHVSWADVDYANVKIERKAGGGREGETLKIQYGGKNELTRACVKKSFAERTAVMNGIDNTPVRNSTVAVPGDRLGSVDEYTAGAGTYVRFGHVYANRAGFKVMEERNDKVRSRKN